MRKLFFLLLAVLSFSAQGQVLEDTVSSEIISLHRKGVDLVVQFADGCCFAPSIQKIQGLGEVMVNQESYLFYKFHGVGMVTKCIHYSDSNGVEMYVTILNPLRVDCDSLLTFASANIEKFKNEKIYPFIYKFKSGDDSAFVRLEYSDRSYFYVGINTRDGSARKILDPVDLENVKLKGEVENLNYTYNSNTSIYKIYLMTQKLLQPIEKTFTYGRSNK